MVAANSLQVLMNGHHVGTLTKHKSGGLSFQYVSEWLNQTTARPASLSLPLTETEYFF